MKLPNCDIIVSDNNGDIISSKAVSNTRTNTRATTKTIENLDGYKIGDILYCSWGYDMTLVNFYQVIDVKPHTIIIKELNQKITDRQGNISSYGYDGYCIAVKNSFKENSETFNCRTNNGDVKIGRHYASKWNGSPVYYNDMD